MGGISCAGPRQLESLPSSEAGIYPKVPFINLEEEAFLQNLVSAMTIF